VSTAVGPTVTSNDPTKTRDTSRPERHTKGSQENPRRNELIRNEKGDTDIGEPEVDPRESLIDERLADVRREQRGRHPEHHRTDESEYADQDGDFICPTEKCEK